MSLNAFQNLEIEFSSDTAAKVSDVQNEREKRVSEQENAPLPDTVRMFPRPRGRGPKGKEWNPVLGDWEEVPNENGGDEQVSPIAQLGITSEVKAEGSVSSKTSSNKLTPEEKTAMKAAKQEEKARKEAVAAAEKEAKKSEKAEAKRVKEELIAAEKAKKDMAKQQAKAEKEASQVAAKAEKEALKAEKQKLREEKAAAAEQEKKLKAAAKAEAKRQRESEAAIEKERKDAEKLAKQDPEKEAAKAAAKIAKEERDAARAVKRAEKEKADELKAAKKKVRDEKKSAKDMREQQLKAELAEKQKKVNDGTASEDDKQWVSKTLGKISDREATSRIMKAKSELEKSIGKEELAKRLTEMLDNEGESLPELELSDNEDED